MSAKKTTKHLEIPQLDVGEVCPCKRKTCERWGDCAACYRHHHLPGKKMPTACERIKRNK